MTIASVSTPDQYTGNGTTLDYNYTAKIFDESHLTVIVRNPTTGVETTLTIATHYTVDDVGEENGGTVSLVAGAFSWIDTNSFFKTDWVINIRRVVPLLQETDVRNQGVFFPETHEDAFDYFVMIAQQLQEQLDRAVQTDVTGETSASELLDAIDDAVAAAEASASEASSSASSAASSASSASTDAATAAAAAAQFTLASQAEAEAGVENTHYMSALRVAQAIAALVGAKNPKILSFTRDLSATTGTVAYTGLGFTPKGVILVGTVTSTAGGGVIIGLVGSTGTQWYLYMDTGVVTDLNWGLVVTTGRLYKPASGTDYNGITVPTLGSDGLSVTYTKVNSPTGTATFVALCFPSPLGG